MASSCVARSGNGAALGLRVQAAKRSRSSEWVNRPMPSIHCTRAIARTFAHRLPKSITLVGTVRGLFRHSEATTQARKSARCADFVRVFLERAKGFEPSTPTLAKKAEPSDFNSIAVHEHSLARTSAKDLADGANKMRSKAAAA